MEQPSQWKILLIQIWPSIYRAINTSISFLLRLTIDGIKRAISQLKGT